MGARIHAFFFTVVFQLVIAPAAYPAEESWEAKRGQLSKKIQESIASLDYLDRAGMACSKNYTNSQCPKAMPEPPRKSFTEAAKKTLKALKAEVDALAPSAKMADAAVGANQVNAVDGCSGAGAISAKDALARKQAVDKMAKVFAKVNSAISTDMGKLFDTGPIFQKTLKACTSEIAGGFFGALAGLSGKLPKSPHDALKTLFTADSSTPKCPRDAVNVFQKLTGTQRGSTSSQLGSLAKDGREYTANLNANSAELAKFAGAGAKVDCRATAETKPEIKGPDDAEPAVADGKKPVKSDVETEPATEKPTVEKPVETAEAPVTEEGPGVTFQPEPGANPEVTAEAPPPHAKNERTRLSGGSKAMLGVAVLGAGAGAAFLILNKKGSGSKGGAIRRPAESGEKKGTSTQTDTGTSTSTATDTDTNSAISTVTSQSTETSSATSTSTQTQTQSDTATMEAGSLGK